MSAWLNEDIPDPKVFDGLVPSLQPGFLLMSQPIEPHVHPVTLINTPPCPFWRAHTSLCGSTAFSSHWCMSNVVETVEKMCSSDPGGVGCKCTALTSVPANLYPCPPSLHMLKGHSTIEAWTPELHTRGQLLGLLWWAHEAENLSIDFFLWKPSIFHMYHMHQNSL